MDTQSDTQRYFGWWISMWDDNRNMWSSRFWKISNLVTLKRTKINFIQREYIFYYYFSFQISIAVQLKERYGGLKGKVVYIDTRNGLSPLRLQGNNRKTLYF